MKRLISVLICCFNICAYSQMTISGNVTMGAVAYPLTASVDANTIVLTWGTSSPTTSNGSCGSQTALDNSAALVTDHILIVSGLTPSTAYTCTVTGIGSINATTAAYTTSIPITGASYGTISRYDDYAPCNQNGDTYYNAISNDGITYVAADDTTTGYSCWNVSAAMMVGKFTSLSPLTAVDANNLQGYGAKGYGPVAQRTSKISGLISVAGCIYAAVGYQNSSDGVVFRQYAGQITKSCNHARTWTNIQGVTTINGSFTSPWDTTLWAGTTPTNFASPNFVMYGADDGTLGYTIAANRIQNGNAYIYMFSNGILANNTACWTGGDAYYLTRVPRAKIGNFNAADWQFYIGGDGTQDAAWSSTQSSAVAILTNAGKLSYANMEYIPALNRYVLLTFYYPSGVIGGTTATWLIYDTPAPWGPFTLVATLSAGTYGFYNPVILQADALNATIASTTMRIMFTGDFTGSALQYSLHYATLTLTH